MSYGFYLGNQYLKAFQDNFETIDSRLDQLRDNLHQESLFFNEQISNINEHIDEIEYTINNLEKERKQLIEQNQFLRDENEMLEQERLNLEGENRHLRDLLSCRYYTYQVAVNRQGNRIPINTPSAFSAAQIDQAWENLGAYNLVGTGQSFVEAEVQTGINALVLAAIAAHESALGRSRIARDKYNLFGFGAFDRDPYNLAHTFNSYHEGTLAVASYLSRNYLTAGGRYYRGGNTLECINAFYATDHLWATRVANMMKIIAEASTDKATVEAWQQYVIN